MTEVKSRLNLKLFLDADKNSNAVERIYCQKVVGHFSVNAKAVYCASAEQLKYIRYKISDNDVTVDFDLNHMNDSVIKKNSKDFKTWNKLNNMFIWVSLNSYHLLAHDEVIFVTFRGNITKIMCSPYERDDWTICAKYSNGIIYLNSFETENDIANNQSASTFQLKCETWGFKFEQFLLTSDPKLQPNPNRTLNENEEFCCVFDRMFNGHRIIYGAEMDGVCSDEKVDLKKNSNFLSEAKFVELKTSRIIQHHKQDQTLRRFKMLKWWAQSYLTGTETIVCGFRNDDGIVKTLRCYKVSELPKLAKGLWDKNVCLNFCIRFLDFVKRVVLENYSQTHNDVWKFDLVPQHKVCVSKVTDISSPYTADFREIKITVRT